MERRREDLFDKGCVLGRENGEGGNGGFWGGEVVVGVAWEDREVEILRGICWLGKE